MTDDMVNAALQSHPKWLPGYDDDTLRTAIAAALEVAGIKRVRRIARNNVWGPGDTYTTIGDQQVDGAGIRPGQYGERWESRWEPSAEQSITAQEDGDE